MRDRKALHPRLQKKIDELISSCEKKGLRVCITECLRTVAEQDALYAKGRTAPGNRVTNARGSSYSSMHQWGVAFDFCRGDGKDAFDNRDGFFDKVGKIGQSLGLEWSGTWKSFSEKAHFQLPDWGSTPSKLKAMYGTPEKFMKTWGGSAGSSKTSTKADSDKAEDVKMTTIKSGSKGAVVKVWQIIVGASPDGDFGAKTVAATKKFQKDHGLSQDGVVGDKTWKAGLKSL